ncbi:MAG: hypothetical protein PUC05_01580, partial [Firmicutes bacterium]|nr:hypothetical protein [Bacillota bacterium]
METKEKKSGCGKWKHGKRVLAGCSLLLVVVLVLVAAKWFFREQPDVPVSGGESDIAQLPAEGDPSMYSPQENIAITMGVVQQLKGYTSTTTGVVRAKLGFIDYEQQVSNKRIADGNDVFTEAVSRSALKKVGEQKYYSDGSDILVRKAVKIDDDSVQWAEDVYAITQEEYLQNYGASPKALTAYIINDSTVVSARLLQSDNDSYTFEYELNAAEAAAYYCREVKTMGGASEYPVFHSVTLTLTIDSAWRPLRLERTENYDISIPLIGNANCTGELTEIFGDFSQTGGINKDDIGPVTEKPQEPEDETLSIITDMLHAQPDYSVVLQGFIEGRLALSIDPDVPQVAVQGVLDGTEIFAAYRGDMLQARVGQISVCMEKESLLEAVNTVLEMIGVEVPSNKDITDELMKGLKVSQSGSVMTASLSTDKLKLAAELDTADGLKLLSVQLIAAIGESEQKISISPAETKVEIPPTESFTDLTGAEKLLAEYAGLLGSASFAFDAQLTVGDGVYDAHILLNKNTGDFSVNTEIEGIPLELICRQGVFYITCGSMKISCTAEDFGELKALELLPETELISKEYTDFINNISVESAVNAINSIEYDGDSLNVRFNIGDDEIAAELRADGLSASGLTVMGNSIGISLTVTESSAEEYALEPQGEYAPASELIRGISAAQNTLKQESFLLGTKLQVTADGIVKFDADAEILLKKRESGFDARIYLVMSDGSTVELIYVSDRFYCDYNGMKLTISKEKLMPILAALKELMGIDIPLLDEMLDVAPEDRIDLSILNPRLPDLSFVNGIELPELPELISGIKSLSAADGELGAVLAGDLLGQEGADDIAVKATFDGGYITGLSVERLPISGVGQTFVNIELQYPDCGVQAPADGEYMQLDSLSRLIEMTEPEDRAGAWELIKGYAGLVDSASFAFDARLTVGETVYDAHILLNKNTGDFAVNTEIEGIPLELICRQGVFYITCGSMKISCIPEDFGDLKALGLLPETELISAQYAEFINNISVESVINAIKSIEYSGDRLHVRFNIGDDEITAELRADGLSASGLTVMENSIGINLTVTESSAEEYALEPQGEYAPASELIRAVSAAQNTLKQESFLLGTKLQVTADGIAKFDADAEILLKKREAGFDVKLYLTASDGSTVELIYVSDRFYCDYN